MVYQSKVTKSTRPGKKFMREVCIKDICKTVHFGARGYSIAPGTKKGDRYCARSSGIKGKDDPVSPNYQSREMWDCVGKKSKR